MAGDRGGDPSGPADGGDLAVYTAASAAYAELRTPWSRSEAYADVTERAVQAGKDPDTSPLPVIRDAGAAPPPPWQPLLALWQLPAGSGAGGRCTWPSGPSSPRCWPCSCCS